MPATFILSLDCEGKWGVADHYDPGAHRSLGDEQLRTAYAGLTSLLEELAIPSTFAFVGLFGTSARSLSKVLESLDGMPEKVRRYLRKGLDDLRGGRSGGWTGEWAVDLVAGSQVPHELALHGVTHVPWSDLSEAEARAELALLDQLDGPVRSADTYIFPRNAVAHTRLLASIGIRGYRLCRRMSRAKSLMSEFDIFAEPEAFPRAEPLLEIPAGYFLNWRHGLRRLVPMEITRLRFGRLLRAANERSQILHLWLHPENIATAPQTLELLRDCLVQVRDAREAGKCVVLTQRDLVQQVAG